MAVLVTVKNDDAERGSCVRLQRRDRYGRNLPGEKIRSLQPGESTLLHVAKDQYLLIWDANQELKK